MFKVISRLYDFSIPPHSSFIQSFSDDNCITIALSHSFFRSLSHTILVFALVSDFLFVLKKFANIFFYRWRSKMSLIVMQKKTMWNVRIKTFELRHELHTSNFRIVNKKNICFFFSYGRTNGSFCKYSLTYTRQSRFFFLLKPPYTHFLFKKRNWSVKVKALKSLDGVFEWERRRARAMNSRDHMSFRYSFLPHSETCNMNIKTTWLKLLHSSRI